MVTHLMLHPSCLYCVWCVPEGSSHCLLVEGMCLAAAISQAQALPSRQTRPAAAS